MSYNCCWCGNMIIGWTDATTFLSKAIHIKCLVKLRREFKKQYGFEIPKGRKEKDYDGQEKKVSTQEKESRTHRLLTEKEMKELGQKKV